MSEKSCASVSRKINRRGRSAQGCLKVVCSGCRALRDYAPAPTVSFPWQDFRSCATLAEEVTLDYATGEPYGQGKSGTALLGIRTPPLLAFAKGSLRPRSIRVLRHWPFDPGGMTVYGLVFE
jgi:hypothetical protein